MKLKIKDLIVRSDQGDAHAAFELAWRYAKGNGVPKDAERAIKLLRRIEHESPEVVRLNVAKMLLADGQSSFSSEIAADCIDKFPPSLYLMGVAARQDGDIRTALIYFGEAAAVGHLPSVFIVWLLSETLITTKVARSIPALVALLRATVAMVRAPDKIESMI